MSLVTELRARANARHTGAEPSPTAQLCAQAAERIEALEAESSVEPDYEAGFDWKAAWYALDHDAARSRSQVVTLRKALDEAARQFERYAALHTAKGTADGDAKASVNAGYAANCRAAISKATGAT